MILTTPNISDKTDLNIDFYISYTCMNSSDFFTGDNQNFHLRLSSRYKTKVPKTVALEINIKVSARVGQLVSVECD